MSGSVGLFLKLMNKSANIFFLYKITVFLMVIFFYFSIYIFIKGGAFDESSFLDMLFL
jgi:preprotein translocase subunit SecG